MPTPPPPQQQQQTQQRQPRIRRSNKNKKLSKPSNFTLSGILGSNRPIFIGLASLVVISLIVNVVLFVRMPGGKFGEAVSVFRANHDLPKWLSTKFKKLRKKIKGLPDEDMPQPERKMKESKPEQQSPEEKNERQLPEEDEHNEPVQVEVEADNAAIIQNIDGGPPHLFPKLPYDPPFSPIPNAEQLIQDVLSGEKPTLAGIVALLQRFINALHESNAELSKLRQAAQLNDYLQAYINLAQAHLKPFDDAYRGKPIFPIRNDESIFVSLAAFREHLLEQTLKSAFDAAAHPEHLFIGIVVQNCFGYGNVICRTGVQVIGKTKDGRPKTRVSDAPPDINGIHDFCNNATYSQYCKSGQVRALYMHDTDALGPAVARYYASKLWGGETYFMQMDSHLEFAPEWDRKYIEEVRLTKNYPRSVLSAYPPGFQTFGEYKGGSRGARLCTCEFSTSPVEEKILRINTGAGYKDNAPKPTQIPFIAAGFFFAHAQFLVNVPFDPYLPWCFMGEEIALSMRAWTAGFDIYAPRQNLIAHQYRPGRLGLPKYWESVGRDAGRPGLNNKLMVRVVRRVKNLVGYPEDTAEKIGESGDELVLTESQNYGLGTNRTREAYLTWTKIDPVKKHCGYIDWCHEGTVE